MKIPRLAYTPGEPSGIGVDLIIQLSQSSCNTEIIVIADKKLLITRAQQLGINIQLEAANLSKAAEKTPPGIIKFIQLETSEPVIAGKLNCNNAESVLKSLDIAITGCLEGTFDGYVTGPAHKGIINDAGINFSGHTEYLAEKTQTKRVVMMLATKGLRVALATTHLPLKDVANAITQPALEEVISILHNDLVDKFGLANPKILVCGLNPHAGEGGHMGREEIETIEPALNELRKNGMTLIGPLPADTLFTPKVLNDADAVLAMYHDQGLPVLKFKGFGNAVNITLGLPIIRTSVDHGTALDLAGTGQADTGSLQTAIETAVEMVTSSFKK